MNIPYGKQTITSEDATEVLKVLNSAYLTTGPKITEFEDAVANYVGVDHAISFSSGTAALHAIMNVLGIKDGDEVITTPISFIATANCILYQDGTPVFADVKENTLLIDPNSVEQRVTDKTEAIISMDYAGQPCNYTELIDIATRYNLSLICDACHSLGAEYKNIKVGQVGDASVFSFHPVKGITTGEGGMIVTGNKSIADRARRFKNHGIDKTYNNRSNWIYDVVGLGYNYRLTDMQAALGISQLEKLDKFIAARKFIAQIYDILFSKMPQIRPLKQEKDRTHAYHIYTISIEDGSRDDLYHYMKGCGIGVNVHYIPIYKHTLYKSLGIINNCPVADRMYEKILTLPIYPMLSFENQRHVYKCIKEFYNG